LLALLLGAQGWSGRLITRMASTQDAVSMPSQASFVQTEMRAAAMKLHTREQAPKEGAAEAKPRENTRDPTVLDYAQFLLDSKEVYQAFEEVCGSVGALEKFRGTGLERVEPLEKDLKVLAADFDAGVADLEVAKYGAEYAAFLRELGEKLTADEAAGASNEVARFMNHYYNHYFAHTAGGRMIGKKMSKMLLGGLELEFYQWEGDVKEYMTKVREDIDEMALGWSPEQRQACLDETGKSFELSGKLLAHLNPEA